MKRTGWAVTGGTVASLVCAGAQAQTVPNAEAGEEIVVTAQKRSERLVDVPMSISARSGEQLVASGIRSTLDLGQVTPGVLMTNIGSGFTPSIRGVSSSGTSAGDESNVALYVDDVYIGNTLAGFFDLPDLERVEILKGPQGTLFGRNATGGAIRLVTRAPQFTAHGSLTADYGFEFHEKNFTGYLTGPLSEGIAASISGSYRKGDGFVKGLAGNAGRTYGGANNYVVRGKLLLNPTETFTATLSADIGQNDNQSGNLVTTSGANPYPGTIANGPYRYAGSTQPKMLTTSHGGSVDAKWHPSDDLTLRSISAYRKYHLSYQVDIDRTNASMSSLGLAAKQRNISEELNLFNDSRARVSWLVGGFYYDARAGNPYFTVFGGDAPLAPIASSYTTSVHTQSFAGFVDLTWNMSDKLHATLGGRYTTEKKTYHYADLVRPAGLRVIDAEKRWNSPTARAVIRYDFAPDANVYASLSNGFKSGVFNALSPLPIPVDPEKIAALEVGAKARVARGLTLTAAFYGYNYRDIQVQAQSLFAGAPVITLSNAARAKIRGMEFTAVGNVTHRLSFNAGVSWMPKADYGAYSTASVIMPIPSSAGPIVGVSVAPYDASGSRMIKAPRFTGNIAVTYTAPVLHGNLAGTISSAYNTSYFAQAGNLTRVPGYNVVNARLAWTDHSDRFTLSLWSTNLGDVRYSTYTAPNIRGDTQTYNQPRQIGIGAGVKF